MLALAAIFCLAFAIYKLGDGEDAAAYGPLGLLGGIGTLLFGGLYGLLVAAVLAGLLIGTRKEGNVRTGCIAGIVVLALVHILPVVGLL